MTTIIHGDDISTSREYLFQLKKNNPHLEFDGRELNLTTLRQAIEGGNLFEEKNLVIIENLSNLAKDLISYLEKENTSPLILWESDNLHPQILRKFPKAKILHFKLKRQIFSFLDSLKPGQGKFSIRLLPAVLKTTEPEIIFHMLVRQFRLMLALLNGRGGNIEELKKLLPWQKEKLKRQGNSFSQEKLLKLYRRLFEIDLAQKTGQTQLSLKQSLDLFLLEI